LLISFPSRYSLTLGDVLDGTISRDDELGFISLYATITWWPEWCILTFPICRLYRRMGYLVMLSCTCAGLDCATWMLCCHRVYCWLIHALWFLVTPSRVVRLEDWVGVAVGEFWPEAVGHLSLCHICILLNE
jgi:hypothetical protein